MPQPKTTPNPTTSTQRGSGKVPGAGLHSISTTGKRYGPTVATVALAVPSYAPHCASTTPTGYTCPELSRAPARPGASDAAKLPSLSAFVKG